MPPESRAVTRLRQRSLPLSSVFPFDMTHVRFLQTADVRGCVPPFLLILFMTQE